MITAALDGDMAAFTTDRLPPRIDVTDEGEIKRACLFLLPYAETLRRMAAAAARRAAAESQPPVGTQAPKRSNPNSRQRRAAKARAAVEGASTKSAPGPWKPVLVPFRVLTLPPCPRSRPAAAPLRSSMTTFNVLPDADKVVALVPFRTSAVPLIRAHINERFGNILDKIGEARKAPRCPASRRTSPSRASSPSPSSRPAITPSRTSRPAPVTRTCSTRSCS